MAKRRLTKHQIARIAGRRQAQRDHTLSNMDDSQLGPTEEGWVISNFGTQADVEPLAGPPVHRCHLRANLGEIATGDKVLWRKAEQAEQKGVVESILPRTSELFRPDGYGKLKIVAANITRAIITVAPEPEAHANLIDRYMVVAHSLDIAPLLVINKCDLLAPNDPLHTLADQYRELGYSVIAVSAHTGEGMVELKALLSEGTSIFVGQSGVGKSSLIQTLLPNEILRIGELSENIRKGRHTTTHATLYHFEFGGHCIDSPGIREFGLWHLSPDQVAAGFMEFRDHIAQCKFRDCKHQNEPGCKLLAARDQGVISTKRFNSYKQIVGSLDDVTVIPRT